MPPNLAPPPASLQFIGTATTVIRAGSFTVLTDPNFLHRGQRAYLGHGLSSRRRTEPALGPDELPALDAVLLSHLHGDHFDRVARRHLRRDIPIITTPHASRRLQGWHRFSRAVGLQTWSGHTLVKGEETLTVTALPGRHARGAVQAVLPPVMGSLLELHTPADGTVLRLYVSGDTVFYEGLREIPRRHPGVQWVVLHLGATTLPGGLLVTMDHLQGCDLIEAIDAPAVTPVHLDDYEIFRFDRAAFDRELDRRGLSSRMVWAAPGETVDLLPPRRS